VRSALTLRSRSRRLPRAAVVSLIVVASFAIGCLESWAQAFLPDALRPLSNSASGWTLVTALLLCWSRARVRTAAMLGAASFVLLIVGYAVALNLRGFAYSPVRWGVIGIVVGPFVGVAATWLQKRGVRAALGGGLLAGIGLGDAIYGLTTVSATTGVAYWITIAVAALALLVYLLLRRVRGTVSTALLVGTTVVVALILWLAFRLI